MGFEFFFSLFINNLLCLGRIVNFLQSEKSIVIRISDHFYANKNAILRCEIFSLL